MTTLAPDTTPIVDEAALFDIPCDSSACDSAAAWVVVWRAGRRPSCTSCGPAAELICGDCANALRYAISIGASAICTCGTYHGQIADLVARVDPL